MFVAITNTPRDYAWGSNGAISQLLGLTASGAPEAELWLGAHSGSPSRIVGTAQTLDEIVEGRLPFLLKVLAAASPLSLQAHPTTKQAAAGFARENALGIPLDAPERNYKDPFHKPELIYALSETFDALCGFRSATDTRAIVDELIARDARSQPSRTAPLLRWREHLADDDSLPGAFEWLITRGEGVDDLIARVAELADESSLELETAALLAEAYPGDPGIVISLMLNRVRLSRGEALYLPAGCIHAYLSGIGIELMSASDNVLRGGLTPKHVDVAELMRVLDFTPRPVPYLRAETPAPGVEVYRPGIPDFVLVRIDGRAAWTLEGAAIVLCTEGGYDVSGARSSTTLARGGSAYITADERVLTFTGEGTAFVATTAG
jgi:mannose-6-phosphate isomerase